MAETKTHYTVKLPLNPTNFPTIDKTVKWDTSEGIFNLSDGYESTCQIIYQWNTTTDFTDPLSSGQLVLSNHSFSASTGIFGNILAISLTSYTNNDLTNYFNSFSSASFVITQLNDPSIFITFNASVINVGADTIIFAVDYNTISSSSPPISGSPNNGELLCLDITPLNAISYSGSTTGACENIEAISINFSTLSIGDSQNLTISSGLTINDEDLIRVTYTPDPTIYVIGYVDSYNVSTGEMTIIIIYLYNDGYSGNSVNQDVTCYFGVSDSIEFIFKRTLFVDPNGDDEISSQLVPIGGSLHPPFRTIQAAIDYVHTNSTYFNEVTIHVFAGTYNVTEQDGYRLELGHDSIQMNLYLEDGVIINCSAVSPSTAYTDPSFFINMLGTQRPSISGHGLIQTSGTENDSAFVSVFKLESSKGCEILVKRINGKLRSNRGVVFYDVTNDSGSRTYFEGEILISDSPNLGLLAMSADSKTKIFEFGHNTNVTMEGQDVGYVTGSFERLPIMIFDNSQVFLRGSWYMDSQSGPDTILWVFSSNSKTIFDGADMYLYTTNSTLINNQSGGEIQFETRETSTTTGVINTPNIIMTVPGLFLEHYDITPIKLIV